MRHGYETASLGADETVNVEETEDVPEAVQALAGGGAAVSVGALGIAETCRNSVLSLGRRGQHLQIGLTTRKEQGMVSLPTDAMVFQEIDLLGSFGMQPTRYDEVFRIVERGKLDPSAVASETITLDDVPETLASMSDYGTVGIPVCNEFARPGARLRRPRSVVVRSWRHGQSAASAAARASIPSATAWR